MDTRSQTLSTLWRARVWLAGAAVALLGLVTTSAWAQPEDPPARVGRLAELQGGVSWFDGEQGVWAEAERNRPITTGDRLSTGLQGRAELRVGSTVLRLGAGSELEVRRLDDDRLVFQLHSGSLAVRVRSREKAEELELLTREVLLRPMRSGHYRLDRLDDTTYAGAWRGALRVEDPAGFTLESGQRAEFWREYRRNGELRFAWNRLDNDDFSQWVARDDARDDRTASQRYVSPEMTGAEDLDRYGRWDRHPDYGPIWYPVEVRSTWAPYRYGRWIWVSPWGWTWVDEAPWGFAPFHYGRWVHWRGRWGWCPGEYVARPVYSPALVAWVGGPQVSINVRIGGPVVGWVPLAPREWYVPQYRHTPVYIERVNPNPVLVGPRPPRPQGGHAPVYANQAVPGGATFVPRDVLNQRQPVGRAVVDVQAPAQQPVFGPAPPQRDGGPVRVAPNPGPASPALPPQRREEGHSPDNRPWGPAARPEREDREDRSNRTPRPERAEPVRPAAQPAGPLPPPMQQAPAQQAPVQQQPAPPSAVPPVQRDERRDDRRDDRRSDREGRDDRFRQILPPPPPAQPVQPAPAAAPARPQALPQPAPAAPTAVPVGPRPPAAAQPAPAKPAATRDDDKKRAPDGPGPRERERER